MREQTEIERRCLQWLDESGAQVAWYDCCDQGTWFWCVAVEPPEELREHLNELAEESATESDGDPLVEVRGALGDPEWCNDDEDEEEDDE